VLAPQGWQRLHLVTFQHIWRHFSGLIDDAVQNAVLYGKVGDPRNNNNNNKNPVLGFHEPAGISK
jgi:hypothetical protein